jgi:hypothetical protein
MAQEDFRAALARLAAAGDVEGIRALIERIQADNAALSDEIARNLAERERLREAVAKAEAQRTKGAN